MHKVGPDYQKECIMNRIYQQVILTYTFLSLMDQRLLRLIKLKIIQHTLRLINKVGMNYQKVGIINIAH